MSGSPQPDDRLSPSRLSRRGFAVAGVAALAVAGLGTARWFNVAAEVTETDMTVAQAHEAAMRKQVLLIDIRRPDEWERIGVGAGAIPIDMRRSDFIPALLHLTEGRPDVAIALICARGVRSARLTAQLQDAGFTNIINVPEGMLGSGAGPGWIAQGLPITHPERLPELINLTANL
jgi:rhodanese-related sulfurtransferase